MTTKLRVWNNALMALGHRRLSDTGEDQQAGHELTYVWDDVVEDCLTAGSWNFATETIVVESDTGVTPEFGYPEVFAKPVDWLRTVAVSQDENFAFPLLQYYDDDDFWSADSSPLYVRYVSNDTGLGLDLGHWPAQFRRYVELEAAARVAYTLTQNGTLAEGVGKLRDEAKKRALNTDNMNEPNPKFAPPSSWTLARGGRSSRERGSRGGLIG